MKSAHRSPFPYYRNAPFSSKLDTIDLHPHFFHLLPVLAALIALGCVSSYDRVQARAAHDLPCPVDKITITPVDDHAFRAAGCGATATYVCVEEGPSHSFGSGPSLIDLARTDAVCIREGMEKPPQQKFATSAFPDSVGGFAFGASLADAQAICTNGGFTWGPMQPAIFRCSGAPTSIGYPATVELGVCSNRVCVLEARVVSTAPADWTQLYTDIRSRLELRYGQLTQYSSTIPPECPSALAACLERGVAHAATVWQWSTRHRIVLAIGRDTEGPAIRVRYETPPPGIAGGL
jgi:hypothetical protein